MNRSTVLKGIDRFRCRSDGSTLAFMAVMLPAMIVMLGLVIDGAFLTRQVLQLETAVDAAARAATSAYDHSVWDSQHVVVIDEAQASAIAQTYLSSNMPGAMLVEVKREPNTTNKLRVTAKTTVQFAFMRIVGIRQREVQAWSVAMKR